MGTELIGVWLIVAVGALSAGEWVVRVRHEEALSTKVRWGFLLAVALGTYLGLWFAGANT